MVRAAAWAAWAACIAAARAVPSVPLLTQTGNCPEVAVATCTDGQIGIVNAVAMSSTNFFVTAGSAAPDYTAAIVWSLSSDGKTATRRTQFPTCAVDANGVKVISTCIGTVDAVVDIALSDDDSVVVVAESAEAYASVFSLDSEGAPAEGLVLPECPVDANGNKVNSNCNGHVNGRGITSVAISTDNLLVVTTGGDWTAVVWSLNVGDKEADGLVTIAGHTDDINDVAISKNNKFIVTASDDSTVIVSKLTTGDPWTVANIAILNEHEYFVNSVALSADNTRMVTGDHDGIAIVWSFDPDTGATAKLATLYQCQAKEPEGCTTTRGSHEIQDLALSDDGQILGIVSKGYVAVWSLSPDGKKATIVAAQEKCKGNPDPNCIGTKGDYESVALSSDKRTLITGDSKGVVFVWSLAQFVDPPPTPKPTPAPTPPPPPPPAPEPWMSTAAQTATGITLGTVMAVVPIAAATREP